MEDPKRANKRPRDETRASVPVRKERATVQAGKGNTRRGREGGFKCSYDGCGKSYSRHEHLTRHQLNREFEDHYHWDAPKEIFRCDFSGCTRSFVRQDLCARHLERHANPGRPSRSLNSEIKSPTALETGADFSSIDLNAVYPPAPSSSAVDCVTGQHFPLGLLPESSLNRSTLATESNDFPDAGQNLPTNTTNHRYSFTNDNVHREDSIMGLSEQAPAVSNTSPLGIGADFAAWLFNDVGNAQNSVLPMSVQSTEDMPNYWDGFGGDWATDIFTSTSLLPSFSDLFQQSFLGSPPRPEPSTANAMLSAKKRNRLIDIMQQRFNEAENFGESKVEVLGGNRDSEEHALSMHSMQLYIASYWYHFHAQMPILHRPTFSADDTHDYLLLAVMVIGASCLDRIHGRSITNAAARLANFIAWHLRWQVYMHADFQPPAKLWIFQTLLLLEVYEKMNAKRALHERAHIHFATTLTLMRRGSSLVWKTSGTATPLISDDSHHSSSGPHQLLREGNPITPDAYWQRWITAEATRRAAFAAFLLDATHSTMFGHGANMLVHEICLPLPCDEALWSATSSAEVGRVEASLHANGIKPITFLEGLKTILNFRKVRANFFGRMILMAGLMSVSWHMRQRDLQSSSLGIRHALGVPNGWRSSLTRSIDFWKKDFDESLAFMRSGASGWQMFSGGIDEEATAEALCTVMYHLGHMAMNVDLADCQIFAGSRRLLGRTVSPTDYQNMKERMTAWSATNRAREAAFHAVSYVKKVLILENAPADLANCSHDELTKSLYNARDDPLFNRPWVLYYAALVLWSYGMALDGALRPFPSHISNRAGDYLTPDADQIRAMFQDAAEYLKGPMGRARNTADLQHVLGGRNRLVGLIGLVRKSFESPHWELLQEASDRLGRAIDMLRG